MNTVAETFPPGEFLRDELEARGWSQTELAEIMGRPVRLINEIIAGKKGITPETATQLGYSLGTSPDLWMNLESQYQLSKVRVTDGLIARRARLYEKFPVREMIKCGWIEATRNVDVLETQFLNFFGVESLDDEVLFSHAAKKTAPDDKPSMLQLAWLCRARRVASELVTPAYSKSALHKALPRLAALLSAPEETRHVARILGECGVKFVVVETIPGTKIDGACFWLDKQPVIALSLRLDRIDNFWFVLRHEIEHVLREHGKDRGYVLDQDIEGAPAETISEEEAVANSAAADFAVSKDEMSGFVARVGPFFGEDRVLLFAQRLQIHPGLVVGQLQRRLHRYDLFRKYQVKVRHFVTASALVDGWGVVHTA